jgi:hypothetical protein
VKNPFSRWLPAITVNPTRKAALGVAGFAIAGAAITGAVSQSAAAGPEQLSTLTRAAVTTGAAAQSAPAPVSAPAQLAAAPAPAAPAPAPAAPAPAPAPAPPAEKALGYDFQLQPNYYYCGPAATRIALSAVGQLYGFDDLAAQLGTTTNGTNSAFDIARVLNAHTGAHTYAAHSVPGQAASSGEVSQLSADVVHSVSGDHVVVANVIGTATDMLGGVHAYEGGHYLTVVGYGDHGNTVKIADPADPQGDGSYWMSTVDLANWIASRGYAAA